jgi:hypothetical protein
MVSSYYEQQVAVGSKFQAENKSWAGLDTVKYQKQIKDLVQHYGAKTILDYGCGKGEQYRQALPYESETNLQTLDEWLGVTVYCYDPCVPEYSQLPPAGTKFDGVICSQVLGTIPDADLAWVSQKLESYTKDFCFISLNYQRPPKGKKIMYDPEFYSANRTREFFKSYFTHWQGSDLFWWWKDREHYADWINDQLSGAWKDIPDRWVGKYQYVESI